MKPNLLSQVEKADVRQEVERQLLEDLRNYGLRQCSLDWSETTAEGHRVAFRDGVLENWSGLQVRDKEGNLVAAGWMEFILADGQTEPVIYWEFLSVLSDEQAFGKEDPGIPIHVWKRLNDETKAWLAEQSYWREDPLVQAWKRTK